ncbi:MAG: hypothetical protein HC867_10070 [Bacteroidia bacterium]|nr:hypothetical protein [Bacteroidia bacterium]
MFFITVVFLSAIILSTDVNAQCSICARTAQQLGEEPAKGLNAGILYLAAAPFIIVGYVYYRWRKNNQG